MARQGAVHGNSVGRGKSLNVEEPSIKLDTFDDERTSTEVDAFLGADYDEEELGSRGDVQKSVSTGYLLLLTCSTFGLQLVWAVLMTNGTVSVNGTFKSPADSRPKPYLRSLGLSNSLTALVWVAGPLCGTIIQPLVGVHSDQCTSSWGRRRPYIVVGACCTLFCILALAFTKEMVECVAYLAGFEDHQDAIKTTTMVIAVIWVWALNIMAQPLQSGIRALIIDRCPAHQQVEASSWASRFSGLGSVFTCAMGFTYLPSWIPFGKTQFRSLAGIAAVALMITVSLNCYFIREDRLQHTKSGETKRSSAKAIFKRLLNVSKTMPPRARSVCKIQFLSWMGWFPFLFYATTYIGDLYVETVMTPDASWTQEEMDAMPGRATRQGNLATMISALVTLSVNLALPLFLKRSRLHQSATRAAPPMTLFGFTLPRLWMMSQILFATCMECTFLARNYHSGIALCAIVGVSWAFTIWVPFALIGAEMSELRLRNAGSVPLIGKGDTDANSDDKVGAIMGIHNMSIAAPQIIAALVCSILFKIFQAACVEDGLAWILRAAGLAAMGAAIMTNRLED